MQDISIQNVSCFKRFVILANTSFQSFCKSFEVLYQSIEVLTEFEFGVGIGIDDSVRYWY